MRKVRPWPAAFLFLFPGAVCRAEVSEAGPPSVAVSSGAAPAAAFTSDDEEAILVDTLWAKFQGLQAVRREGDLSGDDLSPEAGAPRDGRRRSPKKETPGEGRGAEVGRNGGDVSGGLWPGGSGGWRPKVALVLGGGGARGLAHIGVLKVLRRENVPVDMIVGTSVGAIVGALAAAGVPPEEIEKMGTEVGWNKLTDLTTAGVVKLLVSEELLSTQKMEGYLERRFGNKTFADLKTPFAAVAADLRTGEQIILREGSVSLAARASATMPGVFRPVPYRHRLLVDGGIVDNLPTDVAKLLGADVILCVNVPLDLSRNTPENVLTTLNQALYIQGRVISDERLALADVVVEPLVQDVNTFELWKSKECMAAGETAARGALPKIRKTLVERFFKAWAAAAPVKAAPAPGTAK